MDCAASTQSHANQCGSVGGISRDHFCLRIAWCSPFMSEWKANRSRTDCKARLSHFRVKFSGGFCYLQLTDTSRLSARTCTEGSNPFRSAIQSEVQRILPLFPAEGAKHARISRFFLYKPDCRERTARRRGWQLSWLLSGRHMRGPVSGRALGECNTITRRGVDLSDLTFVRVALMEVNECKRLP